MATIQELQAQIERLESALKRERDTTYNGWSNYQTWDVALWLDNDTGLYGDVFDLAELHTNNDDTIPEQTHALAEAIQVYVENLNPHGSDASMFSDLLGYALGAVDWTEIAGHYIEG